VITVAWSPDGKRIASGSWDTTVQVWNAADGSHVYTYKGHSDTVNAVAWSPNGEYIASGSGDKTVQVWNAADGSHIYTYKGHTYEEINPLSTGVNIVAWSPDGSRLASTALFGDYPYRDTTVHVWDLEGHDVYAYKGA